MVGNLRPPESQRLLDAVQRVRGVGVEVLVAPLAHLARPCQQRRRASANSASTKRRGTKSLACPLLISASSPAGVGGR